MEEKELSSKIRAMLNCKPDDFYKKYKKYKEAEAEFKAVYDPFKQNLLDLHKIDEDAPKSVIIGGVKLTYVSPSVRSSIDTKKLKEEEPEIAKKFTKTTSVEATIKVEGF